MTVHAPAPVLSYPVVLSQPRTYKHPQFDGLPVRPERERAHAATTPAMAAKTRKVAGSRSALLASGGAKKVANMAATRHTPKRRGPDLGGEAPVVIAYICWNMPAVQNLPKIPTNAGALRATSTRLTPAKQENRTITGSVPASFVR